MQRHFHLVFASAALVALSTPLPAQYQPYSYAPVPPYGYPMMAPQYAPYTMHAQTMPYGPRQPIVYQANPAQFIPRSSMVSQTAPSQPLPPKDYQAPTPSRIEDIRPLPETVVDPAVMATASPQLAVAPPIGSGPRTGFSAGASFLLLKPYFSNNTAFTTRTNIGSTPADTTTDFPWEMRPAFSGWVGWSTARGLGVRSTYFVFDQQSIPTSTNLTTAQGPTTAIRPPKGLLDLAGGGASFRSPGIALLTGGQDLLTFSSGLGLYVIDLEATKTAHWADLAFVFSGGGRYLHLNQDYRANLTNQFSTASETQTLTFNHMFQGAGPTLATEMYYPLGIVPGLSLYGSFRGSLLLGRFNQTATLSQTVVDPNNLVGGSATINNGNSSSRESVMPITEMDLGFEYVTRVGRLQHLFRASAINQTYFGAGSSSQSDGNLSLFGARLSWGVAY